MINRKAEGEGSIGSTWLACCSYVLLRGRNGSITWLQIRYTNDKIGSERKWKMAGCGPFLSGKHTAVHACGKV